MAQFSHDQTRFLQVYAQCGIIGTACRRLSVDRAVVAEWRLDEDFSAAMDSALEDAVDDAEAELRERAINGTVRILFHQGSPIWKRDPTTGEVMLDDDFNPIAYTEYEKSDSLLLAYMKAHSAKYASNGKSQLEVAGAGGAPLHIVTEYVLPEGKTVADYEDD